MGRLDEIGDRHCVFHDYGEMPQLRSWQLPSTATIGRRPRLRVLELGFDEAELEMRAEGWAPRVSHVQALP